MANIFQKKAKKGHESHFTELIGHFRVVYPIATIPKMSVNVFVA